MGRRPTKPDSVPRLRLRKRGHKTFYFYDHGGKPRREESLGNDYALALKRWAELEGEPRLPAVLMFRTVAERYAKEVIPTKAPRTQRDNAKELAHLLAFFDDPPAPFESIQPLHIRQYMTWRKAPVRAKREKALLSHIWNWAREKGYTALANPCQGIKGVKERGRDVYVEDEQYAAIMAHADRVLRDAMELAYLTGQRPADVLKMTVADVRGGVIKVKQGKTGAMREIAVVGELAALIKEIMGREVCGMRLIVNEAGKAIGVHALSERFRKARELAGLHHIQFRDLRAKSGTDKLLATGDITQAQRLLGHSSSRMTEQYIRARKGERVTPTR